MGILDTLMSSDPRMSSIRSGILEKIGPMAGRRPIAPTFGELAAGLVSGKRQGEKDYLTEELAKTDFKILDDGRIAKINRLTGKIEFVGDQIQSQRKTATDVNGRLRYVDTGELVFKEVEKVEEPDEVISEFKYTVTGPGNNTYNAFEKEGKIVVNIGGKEVPYAPDMFGEGTIAQIATPGQLTKSMMTPPDFNKLRQEIIQDENALNKMARYVATVQDIPSGIEKMSVQFGAYINTLLGENELTLDQLKQRVAEGTFQSLLGANRIEVVGGGVMTEADAERIILALGGDPRQLKTNPEVVTRLISDIFADKYNKYNDNIEAYNSELAMGYGNRYKKRKPIKFTDKQLESLDADALLRLDLADISKFTEYQLRRLDLDLIKDAPEKIAIFEKRMKELGLL
jgi:hypothetical protein